MIALIAEDDTDCDTVREIVHRLLGKNTRTKTWASKGCSTLRRKLSAKLKAMSKEGCNAFIIENLGRNPVLKHGFILITIFSPVLCYNVRNHSEAYGASFPLSFLPNTRTRKSLAPDYGLCAFGLQPSACGENGSLV